MKNKNLKNKGISIPLSYIALAIILLSIGAIATYFFIYQTKLTTQVATSELAKEETRLLEKISLVYWGKDGCILSNDGEISVSIKKIYVDSSIIDLASPIIINPHEKKEINIPYGNSLMVETSSGKLIKLVEKGFTITQQTTWVGSLPSEITTTSYVPITITTTQTSISPTTITTTQPTTQTLTSYISTTYTTTYTSTITQTITTTTPVTITQTSFTTQTITSYIPTTYTTTYATTGTQTITTTIPTTITTTRSTTQTLTSYIPTTYTTTQTLTSTRTMVISPTTITSSYLITATLPFRELYFKAQTWTINGLNAYKLEPSIPSGYIVFFTPYGSGNDITHFGIRVWKRNSTGAETEITNGYPVAIVSVNYTVNPDNTAYGSSLDCPLIYLSPTDSIVVRVYYKKELQNIDWTLIATCSTSQLGVDKFPPTTWVVIYMLKKYSSSYGYCWALILGAWGTYSRINILPPSLTQTRTITTTTVSYTTILYSMIENPSFLIILGIIIASISIEIKKKVRK
ncbi:MAG: hypothetical protein QXM07_07490 [Nitrososphaerota archaeon]